MKTDSIQPDLTDTNQALVGTLKSEELILFDYLKKSMLEIFPLQQDANEQGKVKGVPYFPKMSLEIAESFAFRATEGISQFINDKIETRISQLLQNINIHG